MKALVYTAPNTVEYMDVPMPKCGAGEALVKVSHAGICGSDLAIFHGKHPRAQAPLILAHEFSGVVEEVNDPSGRIKKGQHVLLFPSKWCGKCFVCRTGNNHVCKTLRIIGIDSDGGMAEYACVPADLLYILPNDLPFEIGTLCEPIAVGIHSFDRYRPEFMDTVLVTGCGQIGLLQAILLKKFGTKRVFISDINDFRLELAKQYGLEPINSAKENMLEIILNATAGEGVDVLYEASGTQQAVAEMVALTRCRGTIVQVGVPKGLPPIDMMGLNFKEQTLIGTRTYTHRDYEVAIEFGIKYQDELKKAITHIFPLNQAPEAFELASSGANCLKVMVKCN